MKDKIKKAVTIIAILSLLPIFMGQDDCQLTEPFQKEIENKIKIANKLKKKVQINISFSPLVNIRNNSGSEIISNLNYLVASFLQDFILLYNEYVEEEIILTLSTILQTQNKLSKY